MFSLGGGLTLDPYRGAAIERHPAAKNVRVLVHVEGRCSLKSFVELYTLCNNRTMLTFSRKDDACDHGATAATVSRQEEQAGGDDDDDGQAPKNKQQRRKGQKVLGGLPFQVIVNVFQ